MGKGGLHIQEVPDYGELKDALHMLASPDHLLFVGEWPGCRERCAARLPEGSVP